MSHSIIPKNSISFFDGLSAATIFDEPIKSLMHSLKYQSVIAIGAYCGRLLYYSSDIPPVDCITAVPLHTARLRQRGFNQAEIIAQELAKLLDIPYLPLLRRKVFTQVQASLKNEEERQRNIQNNFCLSPNYEKYIFSRLSILIIDDVTTTGATLNECAKVLKNAGTQKVFGLAVAHGH